MKNKNLKAIANTIRGLSMDGVQKANSGHPGLPLGMADVGAVLFNDFLKFNPKNPNWFNRDRFVLSGGHGSMLLYSLLHLYGYDLSMDDLKDFRQWHSKTPGHPELQDTPGVETTTGPLGQGVANAVGMALAEAHLAAKYNQKEAKIVNHYTYTMLGDGDLQEGVSHEAMAFAGHNKLGKLIALYDSNHITIDGETKLSYSENVKGRFKAYGWHVQKIDGHNFAEIKKALKKAKKSNKPSLIICKTVIGFGSPNKQGKSAAHGSPLGADEIKLTKEALGIPQKDFYVSDEVYEMTQKAIEKGVNKEDKWNEKCTSYKASNEKLYTEFTQVIKGQLPELDIPIFESGSKLATRSASGKVLDYLAENIPALVGGSADLSPSNNTRAASQEAFSKKNKAGNYIHYGVREFGMAAIMNGMALHGGLIPYAGTFFVFSDYMRSAIRMAALMEQQVIYVFTHDSIGLGEDGPTHQPIEHLASLRAIPNLVTFRPMDANETVIGWRVALERKKGPTALVLTRQGLPIIDRKKKGVTDCQAADRGGYVLVQDEEFDTILIASGSEVEIALKAKEILNKKGIKVRVVSMPSTDIFDEQSQKFKENVLPSKITKRVAVEAAASQSWHKYVGLAGKIIGIDSFGASAPIAVLYKEFGITAEKVVEVVESL
ncbi:MAG TPA: transketolase [Lutibacter sp.]|nr:transketolase [Lutibacter sp.]